MDFNRNKKYFEQQNHSAHIIIAAICIALGFLMVVILANTRGISSWLMMSIGFPFLAVGVIIFLWHSVVKIPDGDLDSCIGELDEVFIADFKKRFTTVDPRRIRADLARGIQQPKYNIVNFGTYCFDSTDALHKKGDDGKSRSSIYSFSAFMLKPDSICIGEREVSLISSTIPAPDEFSEYLYIDLGEASLNDMSQNLGYEGTTAYRHLRITSNDGKTLIEFPILSDASADEYVADINLRITRAKEKASESNDNNA